MRIIQTVNDTIRLLFNPKTEAFLLSDFLLVRDTDENFLGQIVEIYDDKFDQEANVAKIRLIYRIVNGNEVVPYDNYTPSRECEVAKIKQSEIEKCINLGKETFIIGNNPKTGDEVSINTGFFKNNCVLFADKYEQTNQFFENAAPKLALQKNVLILDFSGTCHPDGAVSFLAGENFKIPLSSDTIDYIQQKTLLRAKLETQVILGDIFEEVKKYLITSDENYIPFSRFIKVIQTQCKKTPAVELLVLLSWLKKYLRAGIFAKNKREFEPVFKSIEKNKITSIDFSNVKAEWQKEFLEYIVSRLSADIYLLVRLNDNNINNDIINYIYLKKKNIDFIPSFAYGFKKASYIMEFAQNYVLMPTLNPKRDFTHANFQIQALSRENYMLFGTDTKDFIFILENPSPVKKKDEQPEKGKMFIALNLQLDDMTPFELQPDNFEVKEPPSKKKRMQEEIKLSDLLDKEEKKEEPVPDTTEAILEAPIEPEAEPEAEPEIEPEIEDEPAAEQEPQTVLAEDELDYFAYTEQENQAEQNAGAETETNEESEPAADEQTGAAEIIPVESPVEENVPVQIEPAAELNEPILIEPAVEENETAEQAYEKPPLKIAPESVAEQQNNTGKMPPVKQIEGIVEPGIEIEQPMLADFAKTQTVPKEEPINDDILDAIDETNSAISKITSTAAKEAQNNSEAPLHEEEPRENTAALESKRNAADSMNNTEETPGAADRAADVKKDTRADIDNSSAPQNHPAAAGDSSADLIDAKKTIAAEAAPDVPAKNVEDIELETKFEAIMNEEQAENLTAGKLKINDKVSIDLNKIKKEIKKEPKLPVFEDENEQEEPAPVFAQGDIVSHEKYGSGEVLKVISYGAKSLLQIEFSEVGKRLLDPKIVKLEKTREV